MPQAVTFPVGRPREARDTFYFMLRIFKISTNAAFVSRLISQYPEFSHFRAFKNNYTSL